MSTDITFKVQVDKARLDQLMQNGELENIAAPVVKKYAFAIEGEAKQLAPVLTGFLKNSIQAEEAKTKANWTISDGAEYGIFQELGTRYMEGKFFLTRACEKTADKFFDELVKEIK